MPKKRKYLESNVLGTISIKLVHSEAKAQKILFEKHIVSEIPNNADAMVWNISSEKEPTFLVFTERKDFSIDTIGVLAHEATHIAQFFMNDIGEEEPSDEFLAYVVQTATSNLLIQQREYMRKKLIKQS